MTIATDKKYYYSEIFHSIQGEGHYTGVPTAWIRFFLCNLQCNGFGQLDPTNPDTYDLPFEKFDTSTVKRVEDLPVWDKGCDSSYTWSKKFKHLMGHKTAVELAHEIRNTLRTSSNPEGLFLHPVTKQRQHFCVTGGEPLMKHAQEAFIGIMNEFARLGDMPASVTFETNGTQELTQEFKDFWNVDNPITKNVELFFSVSPKLWSVAGEKAKKAIKPEAVAQYRSLSDRGQLKFVVGSEQAQWDEMEEVVAQFKAQGVDYPVWVMPVGAREEEQTATAGAVAKMAFERGYNVAARVHVYLFGNAIGT